MNMVMATKIQESARADVFGKLFGTRVVMVEAAIFDFMGHMSGDYRGGLWDFYTLSNGGFFMTPPESLYKMKSPNGWEGTVNAHTAGVIACMFAFSHLSFNPRFTEVCGEMYHKLLEYTDSLPDEDGIAVAHACD